MTEARFNLGKAFFIVQAEVWCIFGNEPSGVPGRRYQEANAPRCHPAGGSTATLPPFAITSLPLPPISGGMGAKCHEAAQHSAPLKQLGFMALDCSSNSWRNLRPLQGCKSSSRAGLLRWLEECQSAAILQQPNIPLFFRGTAKCHKAEWFCGT